MIDSIKCFLQIKKKIYDFSNILFAYSFRQFNNSIISKMFFPKTKLFVMEKLKSFELWVKSLVHTTFKNFAPSIPGVILVGNCPRLF